MTASAATFVVTKTEDRTTVFATPIAQFTGVQSPRQIFSHPTDVIEFSSLFQTPQTILLLTGELEIDPTGALTINGPGSGLLTVSSNYVSRIFNIYTPADVTINDLKVADGRSSKFGGGIIAHGGGHVVLNNLIVADNAAQSNFGEGGGVANCGGYLSINGSTFSNNSAGGMGGGGIQSGDSCVSGRPYSLTITNSSIINNSTTQNGGGISSGSNTNISNTVISGNSANFGGGLVSDGGTLTAVSFVSNTAAQARRRFARRWCCSHCRLRILLGIPL